LLGSVPLVKKSDSKQQAFVIAPQTNGSMSTRSNKLHVEVTKAVAAATSSLEQIISSEEVVATRRRLKETSELRKRKAQAGSTSNEYRDPRLKSPLTDYQSEAPLLLNCAAQYPSGEEEPARGKWRGSPGKRPLFTAEVKTSEVDLDDSLPLDVDEEVEQQKRPKVMASPVVTRHSVPLKPSTTATQ